MNQLQLVQRLASECGISGTLLTVVGQVGSLLRCVNWISTSWEEIQTKRDDWDWMKSSILLGAGASFPTVAGVAVYPLGIGAGKTGVTALGRWDTDSFRNYLTATGFVGEIFMDPISYGQWRDSYMYGSQRSVQTRPVAVAIAPDKSVCLGPPSDGTYTINADYWTAPTVMTLDADVPTNLPLQYHMVIVYNAMMMYGAYESAAEVFQRGEMQYKKLMAELMANYTPRVDTAPALC